MTKILVINPNSSVDVTDGIRRALSPLGDHFTVVRRKDGPETIRTDEDVAVAARAIADQIATSQDFLGFITACFSDPGLDLARKVTPHPVIGAQEAAVLEACDLASRFGIIALSAHAIPRHLKRIQSLGLIDRLVAEVPLSDVSAADSGRDPVVYKEILRHGAELRDRGAGAVVLGCAGMAQLTKRLEQDLGMPVINPVTAAGKRALSLTGFLRSGNTQYERAKTEVQNEQ